MAQKINIFNLQANNFLTYRVCHQVYITVVYNNIRKRKRNVTGKKKKSIKFSLNFNAVLSTKYIYTGAELTYSIHKSFFTTISLEVTGLVNLMRQVCMAKIWIQINTHEYNLKIDRTAWIQVDWRWIHSLMKVSSQDKKSAQILTSDLELV